ncbi:MAG TPA: 2'-5' RNA ligase family protein [Burkholderiaceae bacterium]
MSPPPAQLDLLSGGDDDTWVPFMLDAVSGKAKSHTLFLALMPEPHSAQRIAQAAEDLRQRHDLKSKCLDAKRLHLTLHTVAHFEPTFVSQRTVDAAMAAAARIRCAPFSVAFDHAKSFPNSDAFVLRSDAGSDASIKHLRQLLTLELRRVELRPKATETPHMTLLYDKHKIEEHPIDPLHWTATRFALILSHVGANHHQHIAEWPLVSA